MPDLRGRVGTQLSTIPHPRILAAKNISLQPPHILEAIKDIGGSASPTILGGITASLPPKIFGGKPESQHPQIFGQLLREDKSSIPPILTEETKIPSFVIPTESIPNGQLPIQSQTIAVDFDLSTASVQLTANIAESFSPVEILSLPSDTAFLALAVLDNLFDPITFVSAMGKNYGHRYTSELVSPMIELPEGQASGNTKRDKTARQTVPKDGKRKRGIEIQGPSLLDLIFPILQPPLTLEQVDNLFLPHPLYPYQRKGVEFLINNESALLADDMGTGKTVMTIVALKILIQRGKARSALILCPPSVLHEWKNHLALWANELHSIFVRGVSGSREIAWKSQAHVYVTTYQTLRSDLEANRLPRDKVSMFDVVILDEAHHIKNPDSRRSRAVRKLQSHQRWALTGTPIQNKVQDLIALFEFLRPGYLNALRAGYLPSNILAEKIAPYFLRRRKVDVMSELPPKRSQEFWLELDPEQLEVYKQVEQNVRNELAALEKVTKQHIFAKMTILKQICNFAPGKFTSPKLELLIEQIEEIVESGNKVIVFSQYLAEGVEKLEQALKPYGVAKIVGGQSDAARSGEIERFKRSPEVPILVATIKSGGEGLNLTEASYVVHFDHWWNPAVRWQAEDRVHRRGQLRGVNVYSYWMADTIDERIYEILEHKGLLIQNIIDDHAETIVDDLITDEEWLDIFGLKPAQKQQTVPETDRWLSMSLSEIRDQLYTITPAEFEQLIQRLMHYLGYPNARVTGQSGDGGIDVISTRNMEHGSEQIAAQCKRYRDNITVSVARDFRGAMTDKGISKGFLITTSDFTGECLRFCQRNSITTVSGLEVAKYIKQFGLTI